MQRTERWKSLCFAPLCLCLSVGCGGGGGSIGTISGNPVPALAALNPNSASAGSTAITLAASGSNFVSTSQIAWNGTALVTTYVSSTSLTAQVPASDLTTAGTASITVQNPTPGGGTSGALSFAINMPPNPVPTIGSLSPTSANAGSAALTLTVAGTQFIAASKVLWNGAALVTTYVSGTSLTAQIPASDLATAGTATVAVQNTSPGGGTSGALNFAINTPPNLAPTIGSLSPSSATVGGPALTLTVTGTQFIAASKVLWNGTALATTYVSSTSLTAQIPASDLTTVGTATVTVQNPSPGGGTSSGLAFTINPPASNLTILDIEGHDITWDPTRKKIYVTVPSASPVNPGTVTVVDPIAGTLGSAVTLASAPTGLAISSDGQYLYTVIAGGATIQRLTLPALALDIHWSLGTDPSFGYPNLAGDIKVQPGSAHTLAVSFGQYGSNSIAVFDDGVERPTVAGNTVVSLGNSMQWKADGSQLYDANTTGNDSPYYTAVSDNALYTMPVTSSGVGPITTYHSSFRGEGVHMEVDPASGYVYGDWCEAVNPSNGVPEGNCRFVRPTGTYYPGPLSVVDSALNRIYVLLEVAKPGGGVIFQIQSFDKTNFQCLSTIYVPAGNGYPTNFIRWGQSGLAFVTNQTSNSGAGSLYLLDGAFVNPTGVPDSVVGNPILPTPTLTSINPLTATVGGGGATVTITGRDFSAQSTVFWNGNPLPTTMLSSTELSAQIPATDLAATGMASITASNSASALPGSNSMPFAVNPAPPVGIQMSVYSSGGSDVVWDAATAKLYVSEPGVQGDTGDAIGIVDPVAGVVTSSGFLGSDPGKLSLSANNGYLYVGLDGANSLEQLTLPSLQVNAAWNLGAAGSFAGPYYALDVEAAPGAPGTTAVVLANFDISPSPAEVVIYDGATARPNPLQVVQYPYSSLQWTADDSTLYAVDQSSSQDFMVLGVNASGPVLNKVYPSLLSPYGTGLHFDAGTGLAYTDGGNAIQVSNGTVVGSYAASGLLVPDATLNRVFILGQTPAQLHTSSYTIESFYETKFTAVGSITIDNVVGTPTAFARWGSSGVAFTTSVGTPYSFQGAGPGQLYVVSGSFVNPSASMSPAQSTPPTAAVQRTWGLGNNAKPAPRSVVVPSPLAQ